MPAPASGMDATPENLAYPPLRKELVVLIAGNPVGRIGIDERGALRFVYEAGYSGIPLSVSMPNIPMGWEASQQVAFPGSSAAIHHISRSLFAEGQASPIASSKIPRSYGERAVRPYLFGLLPDSRDQRESLARQYSVKADDALGLLHHVGLDLPGAVQFCPRDQVDGLPDQANEFVPVTESDIAEDLRRIEAGGNPSWQTPREHWSLAGNQPKLAYAQLEGSWYRCEGAAATTHIVKPGILTLKHEALNETTCLRLARACGVPAVEASYRCFEDVPAIIIQRYDRTVEGRQVLRLHQEDLCQALSVMPEKKYASDHGPDAPTINRLLSHLPNAQDNMTTFTAELFFNALVLAPDAHAKNYSILLFEDGPHMAPLYDCASGSAYKRGDGKPWRLAMGIGGTTHMDQISAHRIERYAKTVGLDPEVCLNLMGNIALRVLQNLGPVFAAVGSEVPSQQQALDELRTHMEDPILRQAERLLNDVLRTLNG